MKVGDKVWITMRQHCASTLVTLVTLVILAEKSRYNAWAVRLADGSITRAQACEMTPASAIDALGSLL